MSNLAELRKAAISRMVDGEGKADVHDRRAAFDNRDAPEQLRALVEKVAKHAYKVTDEDIAAAKAAGYSEDQIFEIVVCAALGQANRQYDNALAALEAATKE